ncbi:hypothetical protein PRIPAC_95311 [Pristionchus pacificus]|uniref:Uncharacterized protein n=1 Tax=Pristionchus pacificus TaxID=54126 RepID=A0A2A6BDP0_PRIPA|nr:hypothetical protein PRIPAC_95311 [Pristionchus pacificus]|eukprot:PDM63994.1 hypothetical protein PRIPAC_49495 [Pristionchus pacificus]
MVKKTRVSSASAEDVMKQREKAREMTAAILNSMSTKVNRKSKKQKIIKKNIRLEYAEKEMERVPPLIIKLEKKLSEEKIHNRS